MTGNADAERIKTFYITPLHRSAPCGTLMGCRLFPPHMSPTFALSRPFPARPTMRPYQRRARDRDNMGNNAPIIQTLTGRQSAVPHLRFSIAQLVAMRIKTRAEKRITELKAILEKLKSAEEFIRKASQEVINDLKDPKHWRKYHKLDYIFDMNGIFSMIPILNAPCQPIIVFLRKR